MINLFKQHLLDLCKCLTVSLWTLRVINWHWWFWQSDIVKGHVNLTCDAWQSSNIDRYFAVSGSWIEEHTATIWTIESALLDSVHLNNAHNSTRLGQALLKVIKQLDVTVSNTSVPITNPNTVREAHCNHTWECRLALVWPNKVQTLGYKPVLGSCDSVQRRWRYVHFESPMSLEQFCCCHMEM